MLSSVFFRVLRGEWDQQKLRKYSLKELNLSFTIPPFIYWDSSRNEWAGTERETRLHNYYTFALSVQETMQIIICPFLLINFQRSGHPEISQDNSETNQHSQSISPPPKPCQGLQISVDSGPELSKLPPKASSAAEAHSDFEILACSSVSFGEVKCILSVNAIETEGQRDTELRTSYSWNDWWDNTLPYVNNLAPLIGISIQFHDESTAKTTTTDPPTYK